MSSDGVGESAMVRGGSMMQGSLVRCFPSPRQATLACHVLRSELKVSRFCMRACREKSPLAVPLEVHLPCGADPPLDALETSGTLSAAEAD